MRCPRPGPKGVSQYLHTEATFADISTCCLLFSHEVVSDSVTPWTAAHQAFLSITNSRSLLKLMSIESVMPSNHLLLCRPLLLLPSIFPSIRVFSSESALWIRWPKDWSFSFSISPSNEYSGLISFRMDCFDLLVVNIGIRLKEIRAKHLCKVGRWIGIKTVLWEVHRNSQTEERVVATLSVIWVGAMVLWVSLVRDSTCWVSHKTTPESWRRASCKNRRLSGQQQNCVTILHTRDFPGGPAIKTPLPMQDVQVQALVGELSPTCHEMWPPKNSHYI